jgi:site-specific recombinase XerD
MSPETLYQYRHHLRRFAAYLDQVGYTDLRLLSLPIVTGFITTTAQEVSYSVIVGLASSLRVFLRYMRREGLLDRDIGKLVEIPQRYSLADIPRSINWEAVQKVLDQPDRRTAVGRRDFAMLLLMATYGLRAREIAALTLDDIDWKRDRLHVRERKADHTTAYPSGTSHRRGNHQLSEEWSARRVEPCPILAAPCTPESADPSRSGEHRHQVFA